MALDSTVLPAVRKHELKSRLSELQKVLADAAKKNAAGNKAAIGSSTRAAAEAAAQAGRKWCVHSVDTLDSAAVREAVMAVLKTNKVSPSQTQAGPFGRVRVRARRGEDHRRKLSLPQRFKSELYTGFEFCVDIFFNNYFPIKDISDVTHIRRPWP